MTHHIDREIITRSFLKPHIDNLVEIVWGGERIETLKNLAPSGKSIGESWECSTHSKHLSEITLNDGTQVTLSQIIEEMPDDILGSEIASEFRRKLPVLVKFLDARENLSVQVHPTNEVAAELGESDTGKTEAWLILDAEPGAVIYLGFREDIVISVFEKDLLDPEVNIAEKYLNAVPVHAGEVYFIPAGSAHAIGNGVFLAEIQQSSGITYRVWDWNREPRRELHVQKAMQSFNFQKSTKADYQLTPQELNNRVERLIDSFYFSVDRITLPAAGEIRIETAGCFHILSCLEGNIELSAQNSRQTLARGESLLVPASLGEYNVYANEKSIVLKSFVLTPQMIDPVIFQTYDVRAIADKYLTDRVCYYLGRGYGSFVRRINNAPDNTLWVTVGGSIRLSTERIRTHVIRGIMDTGINVYDIGITSTPELYFSIPLMNTNGGINLTASHNESEYNGLKQVVCLEGFITSINAQQMIEIKTTVLDGDFLDGNGEYSKVEDGRIAYYHNELVKANCRLGRTIWIKLLEQWKGRLKELLDITSNLDFPEGQDEIKWGQIKSTLQLPSGISQPDTAVKYPFGNIKLVIDFGNGSAWRTKSIYSDLGAEVIAINEEPDGNFPAHTPDPIKAKYRKQLEQMVLKEAARESANEVVGIGNDEDADRVIFVRSDGKAVEGDRSLAIQAKYIVDEHRKSGLPGKPRFMGEVKFSRIAEEYVTVNGGEYVMCPTGFAFIKDGTKTIYQALQSGKDEIELFGRIIHLRENRQPVALAAELSGHQMSGHEENWIFDDSQLAATKILTIIAQEVAKGKTFIDIDESVPRYPATPELNIRLRTNIIAEKEGVVEVVVNRFKEKGYMIDTTDGGLIKWFDVDGNWLGQALVRKSNTQPNIICRVEGKDEPSKQAIEGEFFGELAKVSTPAVPKLDLASDDYIRSVIR